MGKKLFIGKLNYDTTEEALKEAFAAVGEVESVKIIFDRESGRSKGFGFVEMGSDDLAKAAIEQLNNTEVDSRAIVVAEAIEKPRPQRDNFNKRF